MLYNYDVNYLGKKAHELGFVRDSLEKVTRLTDILEYFNTNPILKESLALKGGTAINLTIFNLPRLSVDIDLDYLISNSREEMIESRKTINSIIDKYMVTQGYNKTIRSKSLHSIDSWVYDFIGISGNRDNIKIEINYSLRSHVFEPQERTIVSNYFSFEEKIKTLNPIEIFGSKIIALLNRSAARDLYDVKNMIKYKLFNQTEEMLLKKCVIFYAAIATKKINKTFDTKSIDSITQRKIKTDLLPVINKKDDFNLEISKKLVKEFIADLMTLTKEENEFLNNFENKNYLPELLFKDKDILLRVENHPMAVWKTRK